MKSEQPWTNLQNGKAIDADARSGAESSENYDAREHIQEHVKYLEQQLAEVERKINELMQQSEALSAARKLLMSMPGVGQVNPADMPA
jgi:transposase